jgi:predicted TIM-barrel fold metal-dependent hydrolase
VHVKLSGIGQPGRAWTVDANRPIVETLLGLFGPARCMVGSNFPVDSLCATYGTILGGFVEILSTLSPAERRAVLHDTANRVYAMGLPS